MGRGCIKGDPHGSHCWLWNVLKDLWSLTGIDLQPCFEIFWQSFEVAECWLELRTCSLNIFEWRLISFPMSQFLSNILNMIVFIWSCFFNVFQNLMASGTKFEDHLRFFGSPGPILKILVVLGVPSSQLSCIEFQALVRVTPNLARQPGGGKELIAREHYYKQLGETAYRMQHTA